MSRVSKKSVIAFVSGWLMGRQRWLMLLTGIICRGLGITLLGVGFALRLLGA